MCVCVWGSVCVVVGLNRLIGVSWVCVCVRVTLCVEPVLEVEGEREEKKKTVRKPRKTKSFR